MTAELVRFRREGRVALLTLDDGKRNALSPAMLQAIYDALARAEREELGVVLTGREQTFSAGFDLKVLRSGSTATIRMLRLGYGLTARVLAYPYPVVCAANGHTLAMGAFLALSCDYRLGARGDFKYAAHEVALGMTMPRVGAEVLKLRLTPSAYQRTTVLAEFFDPESACAAGFIDRLVEPAELEAEALRVADNLMKLDMPAHFATKKRVRAEAISNIERGIIGDLRDAVVFGARAFIQQKLGAAKQ
jgi:enoyl-CoA hydratase